MKHYSSTHPLYSRWREQKNRCTNPKNKDYSRYGACGITFSKDFLVFDVYAKYVEALPHAYQNGYTIDRIDTHKGYEKGNLRWATKTVQARNSKKLQTNNTSGYRGVSKLGKKWRAQIYVDNQPILIGIFKFKTDAALAYDAYVLANSLGHTINNVKQSFVCLSDTHGQHGVLDMSAYSTESVLIYAGDWERGRDNNLVETKHFIQWLSSLGFRKTVLIAGNHSKTVEASPEALQAILDLYPSIIYLNNTSCLLGTLKVFGSPYCNTFGNWAFMKDDIDLDKIWQTIPDDTDILITHGPAYMCNDKVNNTWSADPHVGSRALQNRKLELPNLKLHVSGHIHEAYNSYTSNNCINVCPSILDERYNAVNKPIIIEI